MSASEAIVHEPYQTQHLNALTACVVRPLRVGYHRLQFGYATAPQEVPWHSLGYVVHGRAEYAFFRDDQEVDRIVIGPGFRIWLPMGSVRSARVIKEDFVLYSFQFALLGFLDPDVYGVPDDLFTKPRVEKVSKGSQHALLFQRLYRLWMIRTPGSLLQLQGVALELIAQIYERADAKSISPHLQWKVAELINYLSEQYADPDLSLDHCAAFAAWSPKYLIQVFRQVTGVPPMRFLQRLRLEQALPLLESGSYTVSEAAYAVGFRDPSYFTRLFRRHLGIPPSRVLPPRSATDRS